MVTDIVSVIVTDLSAWICLELSTILTTQTHRMPMRRIFLVSSFYYLAWSVPPLLVSEHLAWSFTIFLGAG